MKKILALVMTGIVLIGALPLTMVSAQDAAQTATEEAAGTITFTESEINDSFWVTNPRNRNFSDVSVDLQAEDGGQVTISALYTWRTRGGATHSADVAIVLAPFISNGRLMWDVLDITLDGNAASQEVIGQVNANLMASWHRWIANHAPAGRLTGVTVTDDEITFWYVTR